MESRFTQPTAISSISSSATARTIGPTRTVAAVQNRLRFLLEVTEAVAQGVPVDRIGVRFSPTNPYNDMLDRNPAATFTQAAKALNRYGLAYLHVVEPVARIRLAIANTDSAAPASGFRRAAHSQWRV